MKQKIDERKQLIILFFIFFYCLIIQFLKYNNANPKEVMSSKRKEGVARGQKSGQQPIRQA